MKLTPVTKVTVGMKVSTGQTITAVKRTKKQVHITTISRVDGKPLVERHAIDGQIATTN